MLIYSCAHRLSIVRDSRTSYKIYANAQRLSSYIYFQYSVINERFKRRTSFSSNRFLRNLVCWVCVSFVCMWFLQSVTCNCAYAHPLYSVAMIDLCARAWCAVDGSALDEASRIYCAKYDSLKTRFIACSVISWALYHHLPWIIITGNDLAEYVFAD